MNDFMASIGKDSSSRQSANVEANNATTNETNKQLNTNDYGSLNQLSPPHLLTIPNVPTSISANNVASDDAVAHIKNIFSIFFLLKQVWVQIIIPVVDPVGIKILLLLIFFVRE
jgi:hypothetical protein